MLLSELSTPEILHYASENWGVTDRQIQTYIRRCYTLWHQDFEKKNYIRIYIQIRGVEC